MERSPNIHPGEILREEFLTPLGITLYRLAKDIDVPFTQIKEILDGKRTVIADTAIKLGHYFHMTPQFWLNLQAAYDLEAWLYKNPAALNSVLEGIKAAAEGRVHYAGSFAQYLDLDTDENTGEKDNGPA